MKPALQVSTKGPGAFAVIEPLTKLTKKRTLVGIPASNAGREKALQILAKRRGAKIVKAAKPDDINNAALLYIHTNGSPLKNIPKRPVIEPAIMDPENNKLITEQLEKAVTAALDGKDVTVYLKRAGQVAENAARGWFVNPKNHWPPLKPATVRRKGSSRILIDTAEMRKAITSFVVEE